MFHSNLPYYYDNKFYLLNIYFVPRVVYQLFHLIFIKLYVINMITFLQKGQITWPASARAWGPCVCVLTCAQLLSCDPMDCSAPGSFLHGTSQARILEVSCHFLLQGIFPTQGLTLGLLWLLHWQVDSLPLPGKSIWPTFKHMLLPSAREEKPLL